MATAALTEQRGCEGLFEVDEALATGGRRPSRTPAILLGNLFRDQLDRYGETRRRRRLAGCPTPAFRPFILNSDDPLIADIGNSNGPDTIYFGIEG